MDETKELILARNKDLMERFIVELQKFNPKYNIKYKQDSAYMKFLSYILFFNKKFMTSYITTSGNTIYLANNDFFNRDVHIAISLGTLAHEYLHMKDSKKYGPLYYLGYIIPQVFALLAIPFAFIIGWWALLFLVFLAPLPSIGRTIIEFRGYTMSLFVYHYFYKKENYLNVPGMMRSAGYAMMRRNFNSFAYYFMWPFDMRGRFEKKIDEILNNEIYYSMPETFEIKTALDSLFRE